MHKVLGGFVGAFVAVYLDDILIFSTTPEEHLRHVEQVLQALRANKLYARATKCKFMQHELQYLGHVVGPDGLKVNERKIATGRDWPTPRSPKDLQRFLGLANFFRKFIRAFSTTTALLSSLASQNLKAAEFEQ